MSSLATPGGLPDIFCGLRSRELLKAEDMVRVELGTTTKDTKIRIGETEIKGCTAIDFTVSAEGYSMAELSLKFIVPLSNITSKAANS